MNNRGCVSIMFGALATLALLVLLSSLMRNGDDRRTSTVERVLQPAASVQLEAQQLAAESERARIDAERTAQRDLYVFVGALTLAGMIVLLLFVYLFTRRPQIVEQRVTLQLPPTTLPHEIDAQWRLIDEQMERKGFEIERRR
jgi:hypothetical protein